MKVPTSRLIAGNFNRIAHCILQHVMQKYLKGFKKKKRRLKVETKNTQNGVSTQDREKGFQKHFKHDIICPSLLTKNTPLN